MDRIATTSHLIVGSGNAARFVLELLKALYQNDFKAVLASRTPDAVREKFNEWNNLTISGLSALSGVFDAIWLAVPDAHITTYAERVKAESHRWIHLSGATPLQALGPHVQKGLVVWPVISLASPYQIDQVPLVVESATSDDFIQDLKRTFKNIIELSYEKRLATHMAAVVCNNFVHHIHALLEEELGLQEISEKMLHPILKQTFQRILQGDLKGSQTGPARRGDSATVEKHLTIIKSEKLLNVYKFLTQSIQTYYATELQANTSGNNNLRL